MSSLENVTSSASSHATSPTRDTSTVEAEESQTIDENNDTIKLASKAFGYIKRSAELLGVESTRLAGAVRYYGFSSDPCYSETSATLYTGHKQ